MVDKLMGSYSKWSNSCSNTTSTVLPGFLQSIHLEVLCVVYVNVSIILIRKVHLLFGSYDSHRIHVNGGLR